MVRRCIVADCLSTDATTISHRFPRKRALAANWQHSLDLNHIPLDQLMFKYVVCTQHFLLTDYRNAMSKHLNYTAIPRQRCNTNNSHNNGDGGDCVANGESAHGEDEDNDIVELSDSDGDQPMCDDYEEEAEAMMEGPQPQHDTAGGPTTTTLPEDLNFAEYFVNDGTYTINEDDGGYMIHINSTDQSNAATIYASADAVAETASLLSSAVHAYTASHHSAAAANVVAAVASEQYQHHHHSDDLAYTEQIVAEATNTITLGSDDDDGDANDDNRPTNQPPSVDDENSDDGSYVYLMEINVPDDSAPDVVSDDLPAVLMSDESSQHNVSTTAAVAAMTTHAPIAVDNSLLLPTDNVAENGVAVNESDVRTVEVNAEEEEEDEEEPYALRDTEEVRLYNEMSKRSLIQLLVAANVRIRDLERRLGTIEAAHAKVLGSFEHLNSVLRR